MDDDRPTFSLGRRPYRVDKHDPERQATPPGWRAAQARVTVAVTIVAALVLTAIYAVVEMA